MSAEQSAEQSAEHEGRRWRILGTSVRGAAHIRANLPNQDAIEWLPPPGEGSSLVLALSDGHGGPTYFRSAIGAQLAVNTAIHIGWEHMLSQADISNLSGMKRTAEERLPMALVRSWERAVHKHVEHAPFTAEEQHMLEQQKGLEAFSRVEDNPLLAYGATLIVILVLPTCITYLQLGDGDILTISETGDVARPPLPADERLFADETTSLCSRHAWRDFRIYFQPLVGAVPALILLSTDGYSKSFRDEAGFFAVGSDLLEMMRTDGLASVDSSLSTWLTEASESGSGDDITLGLLYRLNA